MERESLVLHLEFGMSANQSESYLCILGVHHLRMENQLYWLILYKGLEIRGFGYL